MKKIIGVILWCTCFNSGLLSQEIKILTWNIFMIPPVIFKSCQTERAFLIAEYIKNTNADIVVLEESFMESIHDILYKNLHETYPYQSAVSKSGVLKLNSGVWILSKYKIEKQDFITYKKKKGSDIFARKGATYLELNVQHAKLQIIGTHTQSLPKYRETRATQFCQLKNELADRYFQDTIPQFIIGDLNCNYFDTAEYVQMQEMLDIQPIRFSGEPYSWNGLKNDLAYTFSEHTLETLDYILLRKKHARKAEIISSEILHPYSDSCVCDKKFRYLSDHNPLLSKVLLK